MNQGSSQPVLPEMQRALRRAALLTSSAGILFGVLFLLSWLLIWEDRAGLTAGLDPLAYYAEGGFAGTGERPSAATC